MSFLAASSPASSRRRFVKYGAIGAALLGVGGAIGVSSVLFGEDQAAKRQVVLRSLANCILDGALPSADKQEARAQALTNSVSGCETAIAGLSTAAQKELNQLFMLLASGLGQKLTSLSEPWESASIKSVSDWLEGLRFHRIGLLQGAYHGLHDIVLSAFYGDERNWQVFSYGGPVKL